jgi:ankyrin repeat protein
MTGMIRAIAAFVCLLPCACAWATEDKPSQVPSFNCEVARTHEIKPHRRTIPHAGVDSGFNQLHLTLTVSAAGDVLDVKAEGEDKPLAFWPELQPEVLSWKFKPFEVNGHPVTAQIDEYLDLVPTERLPRIHKPAPPLRPDSAITISLSRSGCYGTCPAYQVTVSTDGVVFEGEGFVVATGRHTDTVDANAVRELAKKFVAADFYSMDSEYRAGVTDCAMYTLSVSIDSHTKRVLDYMGKWAGMPAIISDLEDEVDLLAHTAIWIEGTDGLVPALKAEKFDFQSYDAQDILKHAAQHQQVATVHQLIAAGVPLTPLPTPEGKKEFIFDGKPQGGILTASSSTPALLKELIDAGASKNDQEDKNRALAAAARAGLLESVRLLIANGADPNADFRTQEQKEKTEEPTKEMNGAGSVLIEAASSGNPDVVREILKYHPDLETRGSRQQTAIFFAGISHFRNNLDSRAECVHLLIQAGANVNAKDYYGYTLLHRSLWNVDEELLKHGADVNARNNNGETPIFTSENAAIPILIAHGADLTIRNKNGQTVVEATQEHYRDAARMEILDKAIANLKQH